jgi:hypothetical protein
MEVRGLDDRADERAFEKEWNGSSMPVWRSASTVSVV